MAVAYRAEESFARELDAQDALADCRGLFEFPAALRRPDGSECAYLCGNSLGLMPKAARAMVDQEMDDWARFAVEAHMMANHPWISYHELFRDIGARLVGAVPGEVVMMNSLTVNLHLMLVSFYRPRDGRKKILIEDSAFPSDSYALESQLRFHGLDPAHSLIRLKPREGERALRTEDILAAIEREGKSVALVLLGGVNYVTGQLFDMPRIADAAHAAGCVCGFDLAHAAGNVEMFLHDWNVDFAVWCSYKYLNAGPGAVAGCFVHEKHFWRHAADATPRLEGWWGHDPATRFHMSSHFTPAKGADAWQVSNPPILSMAPLLASLRIFDSVGMGDLRLKSIRLTGYLEFLLEKRLGDRVSIITPKRQEERGCQLSVVLRNVGREILDGLRREGVICDFREPNVVRMAPAPLYNTFHDVWRAVEGLARLR